ncbi:unnamed protein product [Pedinophyceae sp. YPF-701]|nr:unnamed protein product [Pedinophyceae sp. YPF-701]
MATAGHAGARATRATLDSEDDDFVFFGTALQKGDDVRGSQYRTRVQDPAVTKGKPVHEQVVTDEQGRRRFHGAFTGGFSAGYFNTVGSEAGWTPSAFVSSRGARAKVAQASVEDYYDDDELREAKKTTLTARTEFDTFGDHATEAERRRTEKDVAAGRSVAATLAAEGALGALLAGGSGAGEGVGAELLVKMGWRKGKGLGRKDSSWAGQQGTDNTEVFRTKPKRDRFGLAYDPYAGRYAEVKEIRDGAAAKKKEALQSRRARGTAFGTGAFDEDTMFGEADDYYEDEDAGPGRGGLGALPTSHPLSRGGAGALGLGADGFAKLRGRGARPMLTSGVSFEEVDPHARALPDPAAPDGQRMLSLTAPGETGARLRGLAPRRESFIAGFLMADEEEPPPRMEPPRVPRSFTPRHTFPPQPPPRAPSPPRQRGATAVQAAAARPPPPDDAALRKAIETLATFVARNGPALEDIARVRNADDERFRFLRGGDGAEYYRWVVARAREAVQVAGAMSRIGQRAAPYMGDGAAVPTGPPPAAAPRREDHGPGPQRSAPLGSIAQGDRERLLASLSQKFVKGTVEGVQGSLDVGEGGLRPGGALSGLPKPAAPVVPEPSAGKPGALEVRRWEEEWRPVPVVCKRFGVRDPFKGKPRAGAAGGAVPRSHTDTISLPETQRMLAEGRVPAAEPAAAAPQAPETAQDRSFPPPPPVRAAPEPAYPAPPPVAPPQPSGEAGGTGDQADDFLASMGFAAAAQAPPPQPGSAPPPPALTHPSFPPPPTPPAPPPAVGPSNAVEGAAGSAPGAPESAPAPAPPPIERPLDVFRAIFQDSDSDEDADEADDGEQRRGEGAGDGRQVAAERAASPKGPSAGGPARERSRSASPSAASSSSGSSSSSSDSGSSSGRGGGEGSGPRSVADLQRQLQELQGRKGTSAGPERLTTAERGLLEIVSALDRHRSGKRRRGHDDEKRRKDSKRRRREKEERRKGKRGKDKKEKRKKRSREDRGSDRGRRDRKEERSDRRRSKSSRR